MFRISRLRAALWISPVLFFLISFPCLFPCLGHSNVNTEEVIGRLKSTYRDVRDMTADFTQRSSIQGFEEKVFGGRLYLKRPKMVRWDYSKPEKQNIYIKGEAVILYLPGQKQAIKQNLFENPDAEPALGLLSDIEIWQDLFNIKGEGETADTFRLELRPRKILQIEKVLVEIHKETFYIHKLTLFEKSGNRVSFNFFNIKSNSGLQDGLFDFKIPRGVEVLEY